MLDFTKRYYIISPFYKCMKKIILSEVVLFYKWKVERGALLPFKYKTNFFRCSFCQIFSKISNCLSPTIPYCINSIIHLKYYLFAIYFNFNSSCISIKLIIEYKWRMGNSNNLITGILL